MVTVLLLHQASTNHPSRCPTNSVDESSESLSTNHASRCPTDQVLEVVMQELVPVVGLLDVANSQASAYRQAPIPS